MEVYPSRAPDHFFVFGQGQKNKHIKTNEQIKTPKQKYLHLHPSSLLYDGKNERIKKFEFSIQTFL